MPSKSLIRIPNFLRDSFGISDKQRAREAPLRIKMGAIDRRPAALPSYFSKRVRVPRIKIGGGLAGGITDETNHMQANLYFFLDMSGFDSRLTIKVDKRAKAARFWIDQKRLVITRITPQCRQFNLRISALAASRPISAVAKNIALQ
jgi:hypothetical protein